MLTRAIGLLARFPVPVLVVFMALAGPGVTVAADSGDASASAAPGDERSGAAVERTGEAAAAPEQTQPDPFTASDRSTAGGFRMWGDLQVAYRSVELNGSEGRFRKDYGLDTGVRLLNSRVTLVPAGTEPAGWFDRIEVFGDGLGGDKYEAWGLRANKANRYRLSFRTRQVDYFWNVTADVHAWDLRRRNTDADLAVNLTDGLELTGTYRGFRQTDARQTTRLLSGEVFDFDEPLDQNGSTWGAGVRWRFGDTLLFASQDFQSFTDNGGFGTRGLNTGAGRNAAFLTFLDQKEVRDMDALTARGGFQTRLAHGRLWLSGDIVSSQQELVFSFQTLARGEDFRQQSVQLEGSTAGRGNRDVLHGNLQAQWRPSDRLSLSARYRRRSWDQLATGDATTSETFSADGSVRSAADLVSSAYRVTINQFIFGAEWAPVESASVFGEIGTGRRKQSFGSDGFVDLASRTEATSYKVGGRLRRGRSFDAEASYESGDIDNPFTRLAPSSADAVKVKLRARPAEGWQISGTYTLWDTRNEVVDAKLSSPEPVKLRTENWGFNIAYGGSEGGRSLYAGYTRLQYDSNVPIRFVGAVFNNYQEGTAVYDSVDDIWSLGGEYRLSPGAPLTLYGRLSTVSSGGTVPLTYYDIATGGRYLSPVGVFVDLQGRFVKYDDRTQLPSMIDDYTGTIVTLGLGYRF